jgi:hypothetical protein
MPSIVIGRDRAAGTVQCSIPNGRGRSGHKQTFRGVPINVRYSPERWAPTTIANPSRCCQRALRSARKPGARSADLPRGPDAARAVKEVTSTLLKRQLRECRYRQISRTPRAWCGSSRPPALYRNELNADLTALSRRPVFVAPSSFRTSLTNLGRGKHRSLGRWYGFFERFHLEQRLGAWFADMAVGRRGFPPVRPACWAPVEASLRPAFPLFQMKQFRFSLMST